MMLDELIKLNNDILGNSTLEKLAVKDTTEIKKKEVELWKAWKQEKNQENFDNLWNSLKPIMNRSLQHHTKGSPVPQSAFRGLAMNLFVKSIDTYDPNRGASLSTHLTNNLKRFNRYNLAYQNVARIQSESRGGKITTFKNRRDLLEDRLGRLPTAIELADDLGWSLKDVERMEQDIRHDIPVGAAHYVTGESLASSRFMDKLNHLYMFQTNPQEKLVMEYLFGLGGKPKIKKNIDIAPKVGITPNRVSQIRNKLALKLKGKN